MIECKQRHLLTTLFSTNYQIFDTHTQNNQERDNMRSSLDMLRGSVDMLQNQLKKHGIAPATEPVPEGEHEDSTTEQPSAHPQGSRHAEDVSTDDNVEEPSREATETSEDEVPGKEDPILVMQRQLLERENRIRELNQALEAAVSENYKLEEREFEGAQEREQLRSVSKMIM